MPKQEWTINTGEAYAGEQYGLATTNSQRLTYSTDAEHSAYGLAVKQGVAYNTIALGSDAGEVLGITMREIKLESKTRPGDGTILIPKGQPLGVMLEGPIMVKLVTAITDADIGVSATGTFGGVATGYTKATNVKALKYPAAAGDVIPVMINMVGPKP
ncbi:hypothetical protein PP101_57 [Pectobacterium phage PP101]|uniref:Uncharacterized protein n=1 Tax=Pectobacterium phage PP101 TaxID=1916414 RepID=A0A1J0MF85_9CAUD|nr:virion structural protein [Pectobacterium phage PP101]APD19713.1 hypothetical protein PP101_57 [Pectobacterium phage PP101]